MSITVATAEEAEECEYLVCCRKGMPSPFTDNETGTCIMCGHEIFFRPHSPKKPARLCMECAAEAIGATKQ